MSFNDVFFYLIAVGTILGGLDYLIGNHFGLGSRFKDGLNCIAPMAFNMTGILILAPSIARLLGPVVAPACRAMGIDPAMFGTLFAIDMGGYSIASELADNQQIGLFAGLIVSAMMGGVITYIIPIGFGLIEEADKDFFIKGLMLGMIPIPVGSLAGGLMMGLPLGTVARNLLPVCLVAVVLIAGLLICPDKLIRFFYALNKFLTAVTVCGLTVGVVIYLTGAGFLPDAMPILEALVIPGRIAVMLVGSLPLMKLLSKLLHPLLEPLGKKLGVNAATLEALLLTTATAIPIFTMLRDMPPKGKTVAIAWMVGTMGVLTAHLGFAMGIDSSVCQPQMTAKLVSGALALGAALLIPTRSAFYQKEEASQPAAIKAS